LESEKYSPILEKLSDKPQKPRIQNDALAEVTIIIPTLNEETAIENVIRNIPFHELPPTQVLVIDGKSKDKTPYIAKDAGAYVVIDPEPGYGQAVKTGLEYATGDVIVLMDGDGTYEPRDIPTLIEPIISGVADLVLGSRLAGKMAPGSMTPINNVGNKLLTKVFNLLYGQNISDTQSGLWATRKQILEKVNGDADKEFGYITSMQATIAKQGYRIAEIPTSYYPRSNGTKPKLSPIKDGWRILSDMIKRRLGFS